ncbi:MAG TPA: PLP-dependent aspartate aminotransferase family protein [Phycisphaerae bacterium]|nr:PLP-dependent aspartate aminotransferase family protein [Phycisphaerae bacterium]HRW51970.1 PLP-dependent aspartate aminotransferase family protein [Phycisphaerae bacterium]
MTQSHEAGFETLCMHYGENREAMFGAAAPPIFQNSTFTYPDSASFHTRQDADATRFDYTRTGNPTTRILEQKIAKLEQGEDCRAFGSGMGAISAAILSCLKAGDHVVTIETVYGPTRRLFSDFLPRFGVETTYVRGTSIEDFEGAIKPNTRLFFVESPSSLFFELQDLPAVARLAREHEIVTMCDNSNATPVFQNPITMGIDVVIHTATKYIGGHSDVVAGLVVGSKERMRAIGRMEGELIGATCDPFAAWLMLRGLRTLPIRMERHRRSGLEVARFIASDPRVRRAFYPGLDLHPQHGLAKRQMRGQAGLFSFELRQASQEATFRVVDALKIFSIGVSWGGYESLAVPLNVVDPATGEPTWIIRLSIGLETVEDLKADLYQALNTLE